jgi:hypothetical protein
MIEGADGHTYDAKNWYVGSEGRTHSLGYNPHLKCHFQRCFSSGIYGSWFARVRVHTYHPTLLAQSGVGDCGQIQPDGARDVGNLTGAAISWED